MKFDLYSELHYTSLGVNPSWFDDILTNSKEVTSRSPNLHEDELRPE